MVSACNGYYAIIQKPCFQRMFNDMITCSLDFSVKKSRIQNSIGSSIPDVYFYILYE